MSTPRSRRTSTGRPCGLLPHARRRHARSCPTGCQDGAERARPGGGGRAGQHRAGPPRPDPAPARPCGGSRPGCRARAPGRLAGSGRDTLRSSATTEAFPTYGSPLTPRGDFGELIAQLLVFAMATRPAAATDRVPRRGARRDRGRRSSRRRLPPRLRRQWRTARARTEESTARCWPGLRDDLAVRRVDGHRGERRGGRPGPASGSTRAAGGGVRRRPGPGASRRGVGRPQSPRRRAPRPGTGRRRRAHRGLRALLAEMQVAPARHPEAM